MICTQVGFQDYMPDLSDDIVLNVNKAPKLIYIDIIMLFI